MLQMMLIGIILYLDRLYFTATSDDFNVAAAQKHNDSPEFN